MEMRRGTEKTGLVRPRRGHESRHVTWRDTLVSLPLWLVGIVHLLFWLSLPTGLLDPLFNDSMHRIGKGGDFFQFYQAGAELLRGRTIYQYTVMDSVPYGPFNKYPPLLPATLGIAAQVFSPRAAYAVWVACVGGLFAALQGHYELTADLPADKLQPAGLFAGIA